MADQGRGVDMEEVFAVLAGMKPRLLAPSQVLTPDFFNLLPAGPSLADDGSVAGTGLTYEVEGTTITAVLTGTAKRVLLASNNPAFLFSQVVVDIQGLSLPAPDLAEWLEAGDVAALRQAILAGNDAILGTRRGDRLFGDGGVDILQGEDGNDRLSGGAGRDALAGGRGGDVLDGGSGRDFLTGGGGPDQFLFRAAPASGADEIEDFRAGVDRLAFDNAAFAGIGREWALAAWRFREGTAAGDASDRFVYQEATGRLWFDRDGTGAAAKVLVARLEAGTDLGAADLLVV